MKLKIGTAKLQEMVSRVIKGAGYNKLIPLTSLMNISLDDKKNLTLITTDATNYLYISEPQIEGDSFSITVPVDTFSKLIARMTCDNVTMELKENCLLVQGNGKYSIELPLDENGELIKYPDPLADFKLKETAEITYVTAANILNSVRPSLAVTLEEPCYVGYYVGDKVVATDLYKVASMDEAVLKEPRLISPEMMNLLSVFTSEKIKISIKDNTVVFYSPGCVVYGNAMDGLDDYDIESFSNLVETEFESRCKIAKGEFLQLLDRLSLFVGAYDKNAVVLTFTKEGLQVSSKASNGVEVLPYVEIENFKDFTCLIDIEMLASQIKSQTSDVVDLYYGLDIAIKMVDGNITHIVALLDDSEA